MTIQEFFRIAPLVFLVLLCASPSWAQAAAEYGATTSTTAATASKAKPVTLSPLPQDQGQSLHLPVREGPPPEIISRHALEERAGKDAGRLLLRSQPKGAKIWIDGQFVGTAPLLLILAPGSYQVEMRGDRLEHSQRRVGLLPGEAQNILFSLVERYPTRIRVR